MSCTIIVESFGHKNIFIIFFFIFLIHPFNYKSQLFWKNTNNIFDFVIKTCVYHLYVFFCFPYIILIYTHEFHGIEFKLKCLSWVYAVPLFDRFFFTQCTVLNPYAKSFLLRKTNPHLLFMCLARLAQNKWINNIMVLWECGSGGVNPAYTYV